MHYAVVKVGCDILLLGLPLAEKPKSVWIFLRAGVTDVRFSA